MPPETTTGQLAEIVYLADPLNMQLADRSSVQYGPMNSFSCFILSCDYVSWGAFFYNNIVFPAQAEYHVFLPILG